MFDPQVRSRAKALNISGCELRSVPQSVVTAYVAVREIAARPQVDHLINQTDPRLRRRRAPRERAGAPAGQGRRW
ncbi:hypothetical protein GWI34_26710 [Actinomadura sp. DSM 109109]|nr:hypothetical protein [Actinomadura lepetitiana]